MLLVRLGSGPETWFQIIVPGTSNNQKINLVPNDNPLLLQTKPTALQGRLDTM